MPLYKHGSYDVSTCISDSGILKLDGPADEQDEGCRTGLGLGEAGDGGGDDVLLGGGGLADGGDGGFRSDAGGDQGCGEQGEVAAGHVEDQGGIGWEGAFPGDGFELAFGVVGGGEDEFRGGVAVGEGCLQAGGYGEGGGDAGDDFKRDVGGAEGFHFLVGAAEDEGVAGLETQDGAACVCMLKHEGVDAGLGDARLAAAFADWDDERGGVGEGEDVVGDEVVGEDDGGGLEETEGAEGEEVGVAGASAAEVDVAGLGFGGSGLWGTCFGGAPGLRCESSTPAIKRDRWGPRIWGTGGGRGSSHRG